ncbi:SGNH/GDSL hydrolase family protein [Pontibacter qinzhouensis]|uniref:SGNH/GDSL hydrolase family protein n=1 Tax=Pontibacter qinzhouensis TaxID=2603253 RepID=A0A5C8K3K9_9BACT|nr:SGNH/GDSL hydrolase family protein [Pontibacter qinzhouensis]TXK44839.1 SGNH/GDSL hydrolase family protein [Pontibacter qinzhouensis]
MSAPTASERTYLALGDSYTIGEGVPEADRWGVLLAELLREHGVSVATPSTIARTGWTTSELSQAVTEANLQQKYDMVSLLIGVNNQYRGQPVERFRVEFEQLLNTAIAIANQEAEHVLVLSIPDWGITPFAAGRDRARIAAEIDAFNQEAQAACHRAGITFILITPLTRAHGSDKEFLAADGLHYARKMHLEWARLALPAALEILR